MLTQNRYLDASTFLNRLFEQSLTAEHIAISIEEEIKRVEDLKIILVDNELQKDPKAVVLIVNDIDSYIPILQQALAELGADKYSREVLNSAAVSKIRAHIIKLLQKP